VVLIASVSCVGWWWLERTHSNVVIAVLPLENLGGDTANNDFADGLTDEIISNLSTANSPK
jgi:TolB-like protein